MDMAFDFATGRALERVSHRPDASFEEETAGGGASPNDHGLDALAAILSMYRIAPDVARWRHELAHDGPVGAAELLRIARRIDGVKAKQVANL